MKDLLKNKFNHLFLLTCIVFESKRSKEIQGRI